MWRATNVWLEKKKAKEKQGWGQETPGELTNGEGRGSQYTTHTAHGKKKRNKGKGERLQV